MWPKRWSETVGHKRIDNRIAKTKRTNNDLQNTTQKTKDWITQAPLRTRGELCCSGRVSNSCSSIRTSLAKLWESALSYNSIICSTGFDPLLVLLSGIVVNNHCIAFALIRPMLEPYIYHTLDGRAIHNTTDAVLVIIV